VLRKASVTGPTDFDHEIILAARTYQGSPGVYLFTPVRIAGSDTAVLVNRGWIYAPDGMSVATKGWRESTTSFAGYAELLPPGVASRRDGVLRRDERIARQLDLATVSSLLPYPVSPLYLVATAQDTTKPVGQRVARLPAPALDEGPHLSYALQWFAFAAIALIGGTAVAVRGRTL
jgi:surfeit locus 1 family protein